jgi:septum formation protein
VLAEAMTSWILASASARRRDLLAEAGQRFTVEASRIEETMRPGESAIAFAVRMAREKGLEVARRRRGRWVLGADTIVILGDAPLGKPASPQHAIEMLRRLSGQMHEVATAFALIDPHAHVFAEKAVTTQVTFRDLEASEIVAYVATGEPLDKAGAYAIQGGACRFVTRIHGSRTNVIGLPMDEVKTALRSAGLWSRGRPGRGK